MLGVVVARRGDGRRGGAGLDGVRAAEVHAARELLELRRELSHHEVELFFVGEVADQPRAAGELEVLRLLQHDEGLGPVFQRDLLGVHLPGGERALDETGLPAADGDRLDGDVLVDADRAVGGLDVGVGAGVLDHQVAGRLDGELPVLIDADLRSARDDHGGKVRLVGRSAHLALLFLTLSRCRRHQDPEPPAQAGARSFGRRAASG